MNIRPRAVRALRDVRSRLRDVAAAQVTVANTAREHSHLALVGEHDKLDEQLDGAATELASARTVHDLDRVADELNDRPRKRLGFYKPTERLAELLLH